MLLAKLYSFGSYSPFAIIAEEIILFNTHVKTLNFAS
jgi:hypothetical protein